VGVLVSSPVWHEEVFMRKRSRWLVVISNDANDWEPCFYIKAWDITKDRHIKNFGDLSDNAPLAYGPAWKGMLDWDVWANYVSDRICHPTMAAALAGLTALKGRL